MSTAPTTKEQTVTVPLSGGAELACSLCADRLLDEVRALPGVQAASVDTATNRLRVSVDPQRLSAADVARRAQAVGARLAASFGHRTYRVGGMDCTNCAQSIEKSVGALPDVLSATVNFPAAKMRVEYRAGTGDVEQIVPRVEALGFTLEDVRAQAGPAPARPSWARRLASPAARVAASGALLLAGLILEHATRAPEPWPDVLLAGSVLLGGYRFALAGLRALRMRTVGTNLLMALAAAGAIALGHWEEAAAVVFLYALGETLEAAAMERTRRSLGALIDAAPSEAVVRRGASEVTVPASSLDVGDLVVVKPGAKIPADGVVVEGVSDVSEAAITGEALPHAKQAGDALYSGSVNGNGVLAVRVTARAADSTLARILHLVEEAQAQKAPTQALVERWGRVYTPIVLASAVGLAALGPLLAPGPDWVYRALTLLVVACPCALVIATPVAFVSGIARAARDGVLVKGGAFLEALAGARQIALDKTGTLTVGRPTVTDIRAVWGTEDRLLSLAASVEAASEHPIGAAVVAAAAERGLVLPKAVNAQAVPGRGVCADVNGTPVLVGSVELLRERGVTVTPEVVRQADALQEQGKTTLLVARGGIVLGVLAVGDTTRPEAADAVAALGRLGLRPTILTGDNALVAKAAGLAVGIEDIRAGLLPEHKLTHVRDLAARGRGGVVFVGDGINDAPALAAATVGVAMGARGTAAALEAADVALMGDDLLRLPAAVRLARATRAVVRQNAVIALGAVALLLATTVTGVLPLPLGVLGHEGSALLVILNGLRLLSPRLTRL